MDGMFELFFVSILGALVFSLLGAINRRVNDGTHMSGINFWFYEKCSDLPVFIREMVLF